MRHLQQACYQRFPTAVLRTGHMRNLCVSTLSSNFYLRSNLKPGQSSLPPSCPVCEHAPLSAEDCNPNKSLRTTIRVFLRTAEKKREASRPKEPKASAPATPVEAVKPALPVPEPVAEQPTAEQTSGANIIVEEAGPLSGPEAAGEPLQGPDQVEKLALLQKGWC